MQKDKSKDAKPFETSKARKFREPPGALSPGPVEGLLTAPQDLSCFKQRPLAIACVHSRRHIKTE